jgi:hypothetical protein
VLQVRGVIVQLDEICRSATTGNAAAMDRAIIKRSLCSVNVGATHRRDEGNTSVAAKALIEIGLLTRSFHLIGDSLACTVQDADSDELVTYFRREIRSPWRLSFERVPEHKPVVLGVTGSRGTPPTRYPLPATRPYEPRPE